MMTIEKILPGCMVSYTRFLRYDQTPPPPAGAPAAVQATTSLRWSRNRCSHGTPRFITAS